MKRITFLIGILLLSVSVNAQIFTDNFDTYTTGALGPQSTSWTTWSGVEGGAEDGIVSTAQASSGANSIYFSSTTVDGGPQDCVLDFGTMYTSGVCTYESKFYVVSGKSAYLNLQATQTVGTTWAIEVYMINGTLSIDDGTTLDVATSSYTPATWFTFKIQANLTSGLWEAFINGSSIGTWNNSVNTLASLNLYPLQGDEFYVDDVKLYYQTSPGAGIDEQSKDKLDAMFQIYPNPTSSDAAVMINLSAESSVEMKVIDMSGKVISTMDCGTMNGASTIDLNTAGMKAGVYLIELSVSGDKVVKRLIIE
jgi:hypothetical protein